MNTKEKQKVVIIGNGMVGHQFIEYLLASDHADDYEITTFSEEPRLAYDRVLLLPIWHSPRENTIATRV